MYRKMILVAGLLAIAIGVPVSAAARSRAKRSSEVRIAMRFLETLGRHDFDAAASLLDEDAVLDLPYVNDGLVVRGRADILRFFRQSMSRSVAGIVYKLAQAYPSPEGRAIVLEISTQGRTAAGREYTNRLVGIFQFRDRKIVLFREYFNSAKLV